MATTYEVEYIKRALTLETIEPPEKARANGNGEVLTSLYGAHLAGGVSAARKAWETLKRHRPDLARLEDYRQNWILADELKNIAVPVYSLTDYPIYSKCLNALVGTSGAGKSWVAIDIAAKIALHEPVLYIAAEGLGGYSTRWEGWKAHHRVKENCNFVFYEKPVNFFEEQTTADFIREVRTEICPNGLGMVIVDTVARCMTGGDENSATDMNKFINNCDHARRELDCGFLLVHHTGKDGKMRGSSALPAAVDSIIFLKRENKQIVLFNSLDQGGKNKYAEESAPKWLELLPVPIEMKGEIVSSAVIVSAERVLPQTKEDKLNTNQKLILEALDGYEAGLTAQALTDATDIKRSTLYKTIKSLIKLEYIVQQDEKYLITESGVDALRF